MLHRIGDIDLAAVDAGFLQRAIEHLPGGTDERLAGEVFLVAGLLADQHDRGVLRAFAEHGLGRVFPQMDRRGNRRPPRAGPRYRAGMLAKLRSAWRSCHRFCGCVRFGARHLAIMAPVERSAPAIRGLINEASGRFRQYFFGISFCIAFTFSRAGLKMLA